MDVLPILYAKQDYGALLVGTRWQPHRVFCTHRPRSRRGIECVVKYRRPDPISAAALISEVLSWALLQWAGVRTLDAVVVEASSRFVRASIAQGLLQYEVEAGTHFGTLFRPDLSPAAPETWASEELADLSEVISIWAADSWLMNLDRGVYGNLLMERDDQERWSLIAADQSDCFLGAGALADGSCFSRSRHHGAAPYLPLLELGLVTLGVEALQQSVRQIQAAAAQIPAATILVPGEWWRQAGVSRQSVIDCLSERAGRIDQIVELAKWEGLSDAMQGGRTLGL